MALCPSVTRREKKKKSDKKSWDIIRIKPLELKPPIGPGAWGTKELAEVELDALGKEDGKPYAQLVISSDWHFFPSCLRELAEFCNELADQLDNE